jgi:hypothetical protein
MRKDAVKRGPFLEWPSFFGGVGDDQPLTDSNAPRPQNGFNIKPAGWVNAAREIPFSSFSHPSQSPPPVIEAPFGPDTALPASEPIRTRKRLRNRRIPSRLTASFACEEFEDEFISMPKSMRLRWRVRCDCGSFDHEGLRGRLSSKTKAPSTTNRRRRCVRD